jgi:hypothetical protein
MVAPVKISAAELGNLAWALLVPACTFVFWSGEPASGEPASGEPASGEPLLCGVWVGTNFALNFAFPLDDARIDAARRRAPRKRARRNPPVCAMSALCACDAMLLAACMIPLYATRPLLHVVAGQSCPSLLFAHAWAVSNGALFAARILLTGASRRLLR